MSIRFLGSLAMLLVMVSGSPVGIAQDLGGTTVDTQLSAVASRLMRFQLSREYKRDLSEADLRITQAALEMEIMLLDNQAHVFQKQLADNKQQLEILQDEEEKLRIGAPSVGSSATLEMLRQNCLLEKQRIAWAIRSSKWEQESNVAAMQREVERFKGQPTKVKLELIRQNVDKLAEELELRQAEVSKGIQPKAATNQIEEKLRTERAALETLELEISREHIEEAIREEQKASQLKLKMLAIESLDEELANLSKFVSQATEIEMNRAKQARMMARIESLQGRLDGFEGVRAEKRGYIEAIQKALQAKVEEKK